MYLRHLCGRFFRSSAVLERIENFVLPQPGEGIVEVEVLNWLVKPNAAVKEFDLLCEARSDKGHIEYKAPYDGIIRKIFYDESSLAEIGKPLYAIEIDDAKYPSQFRVNKDESSSSSSSEDAKDSEDAALVSTAKVETSPAVRHLAKLKNIDLTAITPTGPKGRLLKSDLLSYLEQRDAPCSAAKTAEVPKEQAKPIKVSTKADQVLKITPQQRGMVKSMTAALKIPHLTYCDEVKIDNLISVRQLLKPRAKCKLTVSPFFIKALSLAISEFPTVNSSFIKEDCSEYKVHAAHNVSVAMDTPLGLIVPNIKNCDQLSIIEIAEELNRLQDLASKGRLSVSDLEGGTIALSNIGSIGGTYTRPIILPPQVLIGALGGPRNVLSLKNGQVAEEKVISVSWSADHRLLDGATVARFGNRWKELVEEPSLMLMHLK
mmetsp:Transcript_18642/g.33699  ORF Transcript_18642/g.33699 Transcript_18642/m.33699 type:complete len:432 (-) Transcript_18642:2636-3931(-)